MSRFLGRPRSARAYRNLDVFKQSNCKAAVAQKPKEGQIAATRKLPPVARPRPGRGRHARAQNFSVWNVGMVLIEITRTVEVITLSSYAQDLHNQRKYEKLGAGCCYAAASPSDRIARLPRPQHVQGGPQVEGRGHPGLERRP